MRVTNTAVRWAVCFVALPTLFWLTAPLITRAYRGDPGGFLIADAIVVSLLSSLTAYRSGLGWQGAIRYLITAAIIGVTLTIVVVAVVSSLR